MSDLLGGEEASASDGERQCPRLVGHLFDSCGCHDKVC